MGSNCKPNQARLDLIVGLIVEHFTSRMRGCIRCAQWRDMAKTDHLDPARIKRALEKLKYKTSGKIGARKTRLKANGTQQLPEEIVAVNTLSLELENVEGEWRPVPPVGEDFTSAPSILHSVAKGVTTKAYIRNRADLERVLIKIGVLAAPENMPAPVKRRGGRWGGRPSSGTSETSNQAVGRTASAVTEKNAAQMGAWKAAKPTKRTDKKATTKAIKKTAKGTTKSTAKRTTTKTDKKVVKKTARVAAKKTTGNRKTGTAASQRGAPATRRSTGRK